MSDSAALNGPPDGPVVQSIGIGFRVLYAIVAVMAAAWAASNWRQIPADSQAVVQRFGRVVAVRPAGLVASWPRPVGAVALLPGPDRLLTVQTTSAVPQPGLEDIFTRANSSGLSEGAGAYLTGDGGAVLLSATVTYQVSDPAAYLLAQSHVTPALQRMFAAAAVRISGGRTLDDVLVARPDAADRDPARAAQAEASRQAMRGDMVAEMNRRLASLAAGPDTSLGIVISRVDLDATLPPAAKIAFDGVLVAVQMAEQGIATARTEATRTRQAADREADRLLSAARAAGEERVGEARTRTAPVLSLAANLTPENRAAMLDQVQRDGLATLLHKAGRVTAVDAQSGVRVIVPASPPGSTAP